MPSTRPRQCTHDQQGPHDPHEKHCSSQLRGCGVPALQDEHLSRFHRNRKLATPELGELCRTHFDVTKNSAQGSDPQCLVAVDGNRRVGVATRQHVMASADADNGKPCDFRKRTISAPSGGGSLGTDQVLQFQIQLAQGTWRVQARNGVLNAKGLNIGPESFSKICDGFFFGRTLSISRNVGYAGRKSALVRVGDDFDRQTLHAEIIASTARRWFWRRTGRRRGPPEAPGARCLSRPGRDAGQPAESR